MAEPILKWAGGKRELVPELKARFPEDWKDFHEPMFGGGALFFHLETGRTINDTNTRLANFYRIVKERPEELIERCEKFEDPESEPDPEREFSEELRDGRETKNYFYQMRELFNRRPNNEEFDKLEEAALLLYLNRTCFNGLYRENSSGEFNVPIGRYSNPDWVRAEQVRAASELLQEVEIFNQDFDYVIDEAEEGDIVYLDPPYEPMSETANFTEYSAEGFDLGDQERLIEVAKKLRSRDVHVVVSNSGVMAELFREAGFHVSEVGASRSINSDAENRGKVTEIIATSVPPEEQQGKPQKKLPMD